MAKPEYKIKIKMRDAAKVGKLQEVFRRLKKAEDENTIFEGIIKNGAVEKLGLQTEEDCKVLRENIRGELSKKREYKSTIKDWPEEERPREMLMKRGAENLSPAKLLAIILNYYKPYLRDLKKEVFKVMLLDGRNKIVNDITISEGSLTASVVHPREVIKEAIKESAAAVIFVHNHPSGEPKPSEEDVEITNRLVQACDLVGIRVLDHVIIGGDGYMSFVDAGLMKEG